MGALFSRARAESESESQLAAAFAAAESRLPPASGVRALRQFAWKETSRLGDMSRLTSTPTMAPHHLTYVRGPMEWLDFLELSGSMRMELRLQAGEEALLALVDIPIRTTGTMTPQPKPCILVARRSIPSSGPRVQVQVADASVIECDAEAVAEAHRVASNPRLHPIPWQAVAAWRCDNRRSWDRNLPAFDRPRFGPDPHAPLPPGSRGIPAAQAIAEVHAYNGARVRGEPVDESHACWYPPLIVVPAAPPAQQ